MGLISERIKFPEEEANSATSLAPEFVKVVFNCKVACGSSSDSGEQSGGSTRTGSLDDGILPSTPSPSLLEPTELTFDELSCRPMLQLATSELFRQTKTSDEWSHGIVLERDA